MAIVAPSAAICASEIHENDAPLDDMNAQIGVDAGQDEAGGERRRQEFGDLGAVRSPITVSRLFDGRHQQVDVIVEELQVGLSSLTPPTEGGITTTFAPVSRAILFGV